MTYQEFFFHVVDVVEGISTADPSLIEELHGVLAGALQVDHRRSHDAYQFIYGGPSAGRSCFRLKYFIIADIIRTIAFVDQSVESIRPSSGSSCSSLSSSASRSRSIDGMSPWDECGGTPPRQPAPDESWSGLAAGLQRKDRGEVCMMQARPGSRSTSLRMDSSALRPQQEPVSFHDTHDGSSGSSAARHAFKIFRAYQRATLSIYDAVHESVGGVRRRRLQFLAEPSPTTSSLSMQWNRVITTFSMLLAHWPDGDAQQEGSSA